MTSLTSELSSNNTVECGDVISLQERMSSLLNTTLVDLGRMLNDSLHCVALTYNTQIPALAQVDG